MDNYIPGLDAIIAVNNRLFKQAKRIELLKEALKKIVSPLEHLNYLTAAEMWNIANEALLDDNLDDKAC